jgi:hypothetical protein
VCSNTVTRPDADAGICKVAGVTEHGKHNPGPEYGYRFVVSAARRFSNLGTTHSNLRHGGSSVNRDKDKFGNGNQYSSVPKASARGRTTRERLMSSDHVTERFLGCSHTKLRSRSVSDLH